MTVTYVCDRCETNQQAFGEMAAPPHAPEDWLDVKLQALSGFSSPQRRVLCDACATELQTWFKDVA